MARSRTGGTTAPAPAAPAAPAAAPANLLSGLVGKAKKAAPKKNELPEIVLSGDLEKEAIDTIRLATLDGEIAPILDESKKSLASKLLDLWTKTMWDTKKVPSNFKIVVMEKDGSGKNTLRKDMESTYQVKFRADGLTKIVPDADELEEGQTVQGILLAALMSDQVGLSEENARKLLNPDTGDISVIEQLDLAGSFNSLYTSANAPTKSGVDKLLKYMQATAASRGKTTVELPLFTEEEANALLVTRQVVIVKEGFFERAYTYCRSEQELNKLIRFIKPTLQLGSYDFGISDKKADRINRLEATVREFLSAGGDE